MLINILIQDMKLDLIVVHFIQFQILTAVKVSLFFGIDMSSSVHAKNKNKDILNLIRLGFLRIFFWGGGGVAGWGVVKLYYMFIS